MYIMDDRLEFAQEVIRYLSKDEKVSEVCLKGSLADDTFDEYSDIDISVDVSGHDNGVYAINLPDFLSEKYNISFYDWNPSLLPNKYVLTFAFNKLPVFWLVDIECTAIPHVPSVPWVSVEMAPHLLKLWVANAKYYLRGVDGIELEIYKLAKRVMHEEDIVINNTETLMLQVLEEIKAIASPKCYRYIDECSKVVWQGVSLPHPVR